MISCPERNPNTICMYEKWLVATQPGTEMNVTPEMLDPIIAKATTEPGRFPVADEKSLVIGLPSGHVGDCEQHGKISRDGNED